VREDGTVLGKTPLRLSIQRATVSARPRRFTLEHEGFVTYTHEQADSAGDTSAPAALTPTTSERADATPRRPRQREVVRPAPTPEKPAQPRTADRLDINLAR
jgi:hypothetical protein